jgi:hypothetical protein
VRPSEQEGCPRCGDDGEPKRSALWWMKNISFYIYFEKNKKEGSSLKGELVKL